MALRPPRTSWISWRASAIQHYSPHLHAIKSANLSGTEFQSPLLLQEGWRFDEEIGTITEKCKAQRSITSLWSSSKSKPKQPSHKKPHNSGIQQWSAASIAYNKNSGRAVPAEVQVPERQGQRWQGVLW